jgi:hypothetical protein
MLFIDVHYNNNCLFESNIKITHAQWIHAELPNPKAGDKNNYLSALQREYALNLTQPD